MLGSGTTLVEAVRLRRRAIGCDIDPLAQMIARAKLTPIDPTAAMEAGLTVLSAAQSDYWQDGHRLQQDFQLRFDGKTADFIDYWFLPQHQIELFSLLQHIEALPQGSIRDFLNVVFSSTIIAKSGGVSLARDLAHTRPHRDMKKQPGSAFVEFAKRLERNIAAIDNGMPLGTEESSYLSVNGAMDSSEGHCLAEVRAASADETGLPSESIDLIITSPPYANNAIDYMRAHKFSLVWFGWEITELSRIRAQYLGHDAMSDMEYENLPDQCQETIATLAERDARKAQSLRRYFGEMATVVSEMKRVLKRGGAAVIVVATSNLRGIDVQTHKALASIGESAGFNIAGFGIRRLDRDRRMMPARWGNQQGSQIEARMHDEYVIGLVKS